MAASRSWFGAVAVLALVGVVALAWLAWPRERTAASPRVAPGADEQPGALRDRAATIDVESARAAVKGPVGGDEPIPPVVEPLPDASEESWTFWGTLVRESDGTPIPWLQVFVAARPPSPSDARGRFELELPVSEHPRGSRRRVSVVHPSGTTLFGEELVLEPGLELRVDDEVVWLHGRVVDGLGAPVVPDAVVLSCVLGEDHQRLLGRQTGCDREGRFRVAARVAELTCDSVSIQIWLARTRFPVSTTVAALRSEEGAAVVLDVCPLTIELRASDGGELVEPDLRLVAWRRGSQRAEAQSFPELEDSLDLKLFLERDAERIEIAASAKGCAPWIEEREAPRCGSTLRIELRRLGPDDVLEGVVLDADGRPVEGAFASCSPPSLDREMVAVPAIRGVRTDAQGRFALPFTAGETARVMAYHVRHGSTGEVLVPGGRRDLVLRFRPVARLDVRLSTPEGDEPGVEPTRFALGLADGTWSFDIGARGRVSLEEVPLGSHTLLCVSGDARWWGYFAVDVYETGPQEVRRTLAPARWVEGRLVDDAGAPLSGVEVRRIGAPLADSIEWNPFVGLSDAAGRFRVLLGSDAESEVSFVREGVEVVRERLSAGDGGDVRVGH